MTHPNRHKFADKQIWNTCKFLRNLEHFDLETLVID